MKVLSTRNRWAWLALLLSLYLPACAGSDGAQSETESAQSAENAGALSADEMENGLGPIRALELAALNTSLAEQGEGVFTLKCSACHKMTDRYVGPPLGDVLTRRTPAYVMNMILNPAEMLERHPEAKKMLAEFMMPMPNQNLTQDEARAVVEYLRSVATQP